MSNGRVSVLGAWAARMASRASILSMSAPLSAAVPASAQHQQLRIIHCGALGSSEAQGQRAGTLPWPMDQSRAVSVFLVGVERRAGTQLRQPAALLV